MRGIRQVLCGLAVAVFTAAAAVSCTGPLDETCTLTLRETAVGNASGSQFISIEAGGSWTLSLDYPEGETGWASLSASEGSGSVHTVVLSYAANSSGVSRSVTVTLRCGSKSSAASLVQAGTLPSGKGSPVATATWLELPQTSASDGLTFYSHNMPSGGRNYSFYYDEKSLLSYWVAYPLNKGLIGSYYGRSDAWGYDPMLSSSKQQNVSGGYRDGNNGHYDRGHQLPSADRQGTYAINATTFYGTNMTPQNNAFNSGIWANLEGEVRGWAGSSDTLYVVTGCVTEGASYYVYDRSNRQVTVPTAYWKAVLRYMKGSTYGYNGYIACAFYFDHVQYSRSDKASQPVDKSMAIPVAELEKKLGCQLFVNLPKVVGDETAAKIKTQNPRDVAFWW